ncbi:MAG TPA: AMMECR1 domain-containing protein [Anaerolineae bacterium]|nr:AMMECR1 domain-containing protein [Anaerolineae bacterium]
MDMQILKRLWRFIVRMDVVSILIVVLLGLAALGSCFPPLPSSIEANPTSFSLWQAQARMRYGAFMDILISAGAFRFFRSPLFLLSLAILTTSTLICTLDRWKAVWRRTFHHEISCSAAASDPRFPPLTFEELDQVSIESSVLSPLRRITDINEIQVGTHGLVIYYAGSQGVLLPQVPVEEGWDPQAFLENLWFKVRLPSNSLQAKPTMYTITALVFGEE